MYLSNYVEILFIYIFFLQTSWNIVDGPKKEIFIEFLGFQTFFTKCEKCVIRCSLRLSTEVVIIRVGSSLDSSGLGWLRLKKNISDSGRSDLCWVGCQIEYYQIFSGYFGSDFEFLIAHANSDFGPFGSRSGQILGHLISDSLGFRFVSGWVKFFFLWCFISSRVKFRVRLDLGSSDFKKNSEIYFHQC
jgi:hypothetical protein